MSFFFEILAWLQAHIATISEIGMAAITLARLITALTPTTVDDDAVNSVEAFFRKLIDLISGAVHQRLIR